MINKFDGVFHQLKDYSVITFGLILYSIGWTGFLLPYHVTTGGVTGISAIIFYSTGIPISIPYVIINVILLIIAIKVLGWQYCIRSVFAVITTAVLLSLFQYFIKDAILENELLLSCLIGGMLCGTGIGLAFISNGSTGGTDIIAAIINKYKDISIGRMMLYCDVLIISSSYCVVPDATLRTVVYGLVVMFVMTYVCDIVINGIRQSVQLLIFSEKYDEIASHINIDIHRGVTVLDGMGWYSKQPKKVLVVLAKKNESISIMRLVKSIDSNAFISQSNVVGVYGQGFDKIKG
ncbi:MAG: YitT family protein [Barnesiella sp.]